MSAGSWELHETFLEVMKGGSLSAASRALGVAQPTIRRRIEVLESVLETVLFTRAPNGLIPTDTARAIVPYVEAMAANAYAIARAVSGPSEEVRGTVRVAASDVMGTEVLPSLLVGLRDSFPRLQIELVVSNRNEDLLRRDADIAVRMAPPTQVALVARSLGEVPLGFFGSESYFESHKVPTSVEELRGHSLLGFDRNRLLIEGLEAVGLSLTPRAFRFRTDHDLAYLAAIRAGLGVGVCQKPLAMRGPRLRAVLPELEWGLGVWLVMHEDLRSLRRVRAVFDHLAEGLGRYVESSRTIGG